MRGLKSLEIPEEIGVELVAPYAGAWIEMLLPVDENRANRSHPTRVRGLKWR